MHELGAAMSILDLVRDHVPVERGARVRRIGVRVGALAGVVPDSLDFCFSAVVAGTPYDGAWLAIERVPATGACRDCCRSFDVDAVILKCPACGGSRLSVTRGDDLQVVDVELDEPEEIAS